jgi:hypothetical protein
MMSNTAPYDSRCGSSRAASVWGHLPSRHVRIWICTFYALEIEILAAEIFDFVPGALREDGIEHLVIE